ncbi:MAG: O-methyltransferase [Myxococcaceae bacterium]|nr:O-methyltransferase [Myxococcaceae bacterium]
MTPLTSLPPPPVALLDLATGYQRARTLFTLVELALPTLLAAAPLPREAIAQRLGVHPLAADRFLNACVALGLLERDGVTFRNAPDASTFLVRGAPTYLGDQVLLHARTTYGLWSDLTTTLKTWRPGATDGATPAEDDQGADAMRGQHNLALLVGHSLGGAYDFSQHRHLLDLGGGTGAMAISVCALHPSLRATVYDLPAVADAARGCVREAELADRVAVAEGNFKTDPLPDGYDVALLANLLSVSSEETNRALLRRLYEQLPSGGAVILSGWILDEGRTSPTIPVLFCLQDISWNAPDVERSAGNYVGWLRDAGFVDVAHRPLCPPSSMVVGHKP